MAETAKVEEFKYEAEMSQLLHLIIHSLYSHREIFLRELISNACDALSKVRVEELTNKDILDAESELKIKLQLDEENGVLTIEDNGIGLTRDELIQNLGTIAKSGTREFLKQLSEQKDKQPAELIGQFGVGFYSVFMVCDEVTVETRSLHKDGTGYRWVSKGDSSYTIEETDKAERGTRIIVKLNDNGQDFKTKYAIENIVKKYSDFVPFPIEMDDKAINQSKAVWQKSESDVTEEERNEFYKYIAGDFEDPMAYKFLDIEGKVMFKSLIFIPAKPPMNLYRENEESSLNLYVKRVFIQDDNKDLLPAYLRFVKGVVDTESLPLNVSREVTQNSPVVKKIQEILTNNILKMIEGWAEKDPAKFKQFYENFGSFLKEGTHYDVARKDRLVNLMRFESSALDAGTMTSLKDYVGRMRSEQKEIYYLLGPDRETILRNPNMEYCRSKDLEVLLLTDPIDEIILPGVREFDGKPIVSVTKAEFAEDAGSGEKLGEADTNELVTKIQAVLGEQVKEVRVSNRLVNSPATLVPDKDAMDPQMERMMKMMNKDFAGSKPVFEINPRSEIIKNLSAKHKVKADNPLIDQVVLHLFQTAQLMDGNLTNLGEYLERTHKFIEDAVKI